MTQISTLFTRSGLTISSGEEKLFTELLSQFMAYNAHTNLSAIREEDAVVEKHFIDSVMLSRFERLSGRMLDIGTGGGFPGIPLKILFPELEVTLLDSVRKKITACETFIAALGLSGIRGVWGRAEEVIKQPEMSRGFDYITSRATAYMPQILEWAAPFLKSDGKIILYKLPSEEELRDAVPVLKKLGLRITREHSYELADQTRKIFVIERY